MRRIILAHKVRGTFVYPKEHKRGQLHPGLLLVHGWRGGSRRYIEMGETLFAPLGFVCFALDLRGHGKSGGDIEKVSRKDHLDDVVAAYDALAANPRVDAGRIYALGASYGAYLVALASGRRRFRGLALRAPASHPDRGFRRRYNYVTDEERNVYRRTALWPDANRAFRALARFAGDVLLIDGWRDDVVPHRTILNYLRALEKARVTRRQIMCADHVLSSPRARNAVNRAVANWLQKQVSKKN